MDEMDGKCRKCKNYGSKICSRCDMYYDEFDPMDDQPQTNADRIRAMTDEELDEFLNEVQGDAYLVGFHQRAESRFTPYGKRWLDWLKKEADDGDHDH